MPRGGRPIAYARVSTLGKTVEDAHQLNGWMPRGVAFGTSRRRDLAEMGGGGAEVETYDIGDRVVTNVITGELVACDGAEVVTEDQW